MEPRGAGGALHHSPIGKWFTGLLDRPGGSEVGGQKTGAGAGARAAAGTAGARAAAGARGTTGARVGAAGAV